MMAEFGHPPLSHTLIGITTDWGATPAMPNPLIGAAAVVETKVP
jgi:hypothetical protein